MYFVKAGVLVVLVIGLNILKSECGTVEKSVCTVCNKYE